MNGALPARFADLEPLAAAGWCLSTEGERVRKRHASSPAELRDFYKRFVPHLEAVIAHLDATETHPLGAADERLLDLLMAMAEVSFAVEKFDADESTYAGIAAHRFVPVHEEAGGGLPVPDEYR